MDDPRTSSPHPISRAAFIVQPHEGGTFTVFLGLRDALAKRGIQLDWVGRSSTPDLVRAKFPNEISRGTLIDSGKLTPDQCGQAFVDACASYELVFVNVLTSVQEMSVAAYLPAQARCVMIVHNITPGTYSAARAIAPFVDAAVGVSPRIQQDLVKRLKFPAAQAFCVPNALNLAPFANLQKPPSSATLKLLFLGRMFDADKGIWWLPEILSRVSDLDVTLTVAGDGDDLDELKRRSSSLGSRINFLGRVSYQQTPGLLAAHDALIMPSRFEGFGYTLIEAMIARCVPIASRISGVTDFVVEENKTGLLFPIGDTAAAAGCVRRLATDRTLLDRLAAAGPTAVQERFSLDTFTKGYSGVIDAISKKPPSRSSLAGTPYRPVSVGGGWRKHIPLPLKNFLRKYLNR